MENTFVGFDPADDPDKTNYCVGTVKDGHVFIEQVGTVTGRFPSSLVVDSQPPKFNTPEDFWKYDPSPEFEARAKKFAAAMGVSMDLSGLESHVADATARHRHYAEAWERRMAGPRKRLADITNELMDKFLRARMPRVNKFKVVRASKARKRKHRLGRTRSYPEQVPMINWVSPTGRLNPTQPAQYHFAKSGIKRTPYG